MTEDQIKQLVHEVILEILGNSSAIPLEIQRALMARGFVCGNGPLTGVITGNGTNPATAIASSVNETLYAANTSNGTTTSPFTVKNGVITA